MARRIVSDFQSNNTGDMDMKEQQFLKEQGVWFEAIPHRPTFTAQQTAQAIGVKGDEVAKSVLLRADGTYALAVLQATHHIDLMQAGKVLGAKSVELASEEQLKNLFPDCEVGALPPFGSQYGLKTIVDESLTHDENIVIEGNTHDEAIRMKYADFERLEHPRVAAFSYHA
jgi:Ala-tRNA(Pro) deacylase